jgi:hypothetical protein
VLGRGVVGGQGAVVWAATRLRPAFSAASSVAGSTSAFFSMIRSRRRASTTKYISLSRSTGRL